MKVVKHFFATSFFFVAFAVAYAAHASTPPIFEESFESLELIGDNGGSYEGIEIAEGIVGNAVKFSGPDTLSYAVNNFNADAGTLSFWVRPHYPLIDEDSHTFVSFREQGNTSWMFSISDGWWETSGGTNRFYFIYQPLNLQASERTNVEFFTGNTWKFITVVWRSVSHADGPLMELYVNGMLSVRRDSFNPNPPYNTPFSGPLADISIGSDSQGGGHAESSMDELRIYDRALTSSEIDEMYKNYLGDQWDHHRNWEWTEPEIHWEYQPVRDAQGKILENRFILDEEPLFFSQSVDVAVSRIREAGFNAYMPAIWHGSGTKWVSDIEEFDTKFATYFSDGADPFADLIVKAHANDIEVHPWFTVGLRYWDKYPEWFAGDDAVMSRFYNIHHPAFRKHMADMIVEVATKYDVDGINLDYVRTGGICVTQYCQDDYFQKTGRNLLSDINYTSTALMPDALFEWQANAMEALLRDIRDRVKAVKPHLVISAYAPASEGFYRFGFPTLSLSPYARNPIYWLQKDLVDLVFDSSYGERVYSVYFEEARSLIDREERFIKVLGNYAKNADGIVVPRDPALLKKLVDYNQRRWPGSTSVYLYSMLNQSQRDMLKGGPFKEPASTTWSSAPIIHGITDDTLIQGQSFDPRENITATDVQDGDLTASITIQGAVDTTVPGTYTLTYTVTDRDHNTTTHIRTITVLAEDPTPPTIPQTPIYRFYSQKHQAHFYTISKEEKDYIQHTYPAETWNYEGIAYNAITQSIENATPIYRFYSQTNQKHFFTISEQEKTDLINNKYPEAKFNYEGIAWYAHEAPQSFTTPLYRFYSQQNTVHFYTVSKEEKDYIQTTYPTHIWNYEGIAWYGVK